MNLIFSPSLTQFKYGIQNSESLEQWFENHPQFIGLAFVGRSNVGKSSLINSIFGKATARTSKTPGRTREINIFSFQISDQSDPQKALDFPSLYLFDLPGYGHAKVSKEMSKNWDAMIGTFFKNLRPSTLLINLQDARHPYQKSDLAFQNFAQQFNLNTSLIFNKIDKLKTQKERAALKKLTPELFLKSDWAKSLFFVSAEKKTGLLELKNALIQHVLGFSD